MKILFTDNSLHCLTNFRVDCLLALYKQGHSIIAVTPLGENYDLPKVCEFVKLYRVPISRSNTNPLLDLKYMFALRRIYELENPDYIFNFTIKPNIYGTLAAKSLGINSTSMIAGLGYIFSSSGIINKIVQQLYKFALKFSDNIFVLNTANQKLLIDRGIVEPSKIILLKGGEGVNLKTFSKLSMPNNPKPIFLMIARVLYDKGYSEFVAAAKKLHTVAEFRLIGSIDENPAAVPKDVVSKDVSDGYINYIGFTKDVVKNISEADCVVLPSYYFEGLSRSLMEGLAIGRPIITTDFPGCRETVDDGVNGFLVEPKSSEAFIKAIEEFIALPKQKKEDMANASRLKAESEFDVNNVIDMYNGIISKYKQ